VPVLLADDGVGRMLLDYVSGGDLHDAGADARDSIAADLPFVTIGFPIHAASTLVS
jgi:hypothetical protein